MGDAVVDFPPERHAVFRDENAASKFRGVVLAKKPQSLGQGVPVPPLARQAVHQAAAQTFPAKLQVHEGRRAEEMSGKRIVIIEAEVIEHALALGLPDRLEKIAEAFRDRMLRSQDVDQEMKEPPEPYKGIRSMRSRNATAIFSRR